MLNTTHYAAENGYVPDAELRELVEDPQAEKAAGTTSPVCVVTGGAIAASAALPDFCPSSACTTQC